ncbi:MAG TPA: type II toxin-antitoxin system prevent-host-death family antitoxin [Polyangiaceae bacterium]
MTVLGVARFKATCLEVLERVARTGEEITITKRGKAIARVVPSIAGEKRHPQSTLQGTVEITGDIVEPATSAGTWEVLRVSELVKPRRRKS